MRVTLVDVAKKAHVSVATAARVLGQYGSVGAATREKVLKAAEELGYVPNALARSMVTARTYTIGLVIPDIRNMFFASVARAIEKRAHTENYRLFVCDTDNDMDREEAYLQDLYERRVDGLIVASSAASGHVHKSLKRSTAPVVLIDRELRDVPFDTVRTDHEAGAFLATEHLIKLGHRRIGIVVGTGSESVHEQRVDGYRQALEQHGIPFDPDLVKRRDWETGHESVDELLALSKPPTAIFATNPVVTVAVLVDLKRLRVQVGTDIALVAFDDLDTAELFNPPLTVVAQNPTQIGSTAIDVLLQRISGEVTGPPQEIIFRPSLLVRGSCGSHRIHEEVT